jgi:RNA polymerase sigma-70 factor (ECF subfamily)
VNPDPDGLLDILERHGAELHALLTRLTLRADAAEDLLQDLFLRLRSSAGFARAADPKGYIFRTAANLAFDWRRTHRESEPLSADPPGDVERTLDRLIDAEDLERVLDALNCVTPLGREILVLHYLQHQDYAEIANHIGKTEHQVRGLCHKAIAHLRMILTPTSDAPER